MIPFILYIILACFTLRYIHKRLPHSKKTLKAKKTLINFFEKYIFIIIILWSCICFTYTINAIISYLGLTPDDGSDSSHKLESNFP